MACCGKDDGGKGILNVGAIQHKFGTAAALKKKNPLLLAGEVVYESDTGKSKLGPGYWNDLDYLGDNDTATDAEFAEMMAELGLTSGSGE